MNNRTIVHRGTKFALERCTVEDRDGRERVYEFISHAGAAVILPILDDGQVVLIRNYRFVLDAELLELPCGTIDPPETPLSCARRELREETGYEAGELSPLVSFYSTPGICTEHMHAFVARGLKAGAVEHEPGERIEVVRMSLGDALAAIRDGRIVDAKTMLTLLHHDRFAGR